MECQIIYDCNGVLNGSLRSCRIEVANLQEAADFAKEQHDRLETAFVKGRVITTVGYILGESEGLSITHYITSYVKDEYTKAKEIF